MHLDLTPSNILLAVRGGGGAGSGSGRPDFVPKVDARPIISLSQFPVDASLPAEPPHLLNSELPFCSSDLSLEGLPQPTARLAACCPM